MKNNPTNDGKLVYCEECSLCIHIELGLYSVCAGPCGKSYHISCIGMSSDQLRNVSNGMVWLCKECLPAFTKWRNVTQKSSTPSPDATSAIDEISELKLEISSIKDTLNRLIMHDPSAISASPLHSTPNATSTELMAGTNNSYLSDTELARNEQSETQEAQTNDCFSLLLTNINSATTENDVEMMVHRCLGAPTGDCVNVIKLVPKRTDCRSLDYISFKIVLKWRWKDLAMRASTWPYGIKFRAFVNRSSNAWKP